MIRRRRSWRRHLAAAAWGLLTVPALALGAVGGEPARFVAGLEDLPLMPGLDAVREAGVWFDTPQGRIVEAYATGPVTRGAIEAFYAETLPQLGWREVETGVWYYPFTVEETRGFRTAGTRPQPASTRVLPGMSPAQLCALLGIGSRAEGRLERIVFPRVDPGLTGAAPESVWIPEGTRELVFRSNDQGEVVVPVHKIEETLRVVLPYR